MLADESDDVLRRIAFGRGSSPEEAAAASAELERRAGADSSAGAGRPDDPFPLPVEASLEETTVVVGLIGSRARRLLPFLVTAAAAAFLGGAAVASYGASQVPAAPSLPTDSSTRVSLQPVTTASTVVTDAGTGEVIYEIPNRVVDSSGAADQWLNTGVGDDTPLPAHLDDLRLRTSRYIGQIGDLGGLWAARDADGAYCLVTQDRPYGGAAAGCTPEAAFPTGGVYMGTDKYTVLWNESSLIVSISTRS